MESNAFSDIGKSAVKKRAFADGQKKVKRRAGHIAKGEAEDPEQLETPTKTVTIDDVLMQFLSTGMNNGNGSSPITPYPSSLGSSVGSRSEEFLISKLSDQTITTLLAKMNIHNPSTDTIKLLDEISIRVLISSFVHSTSLVQFKTCMTEFGLHVLTAAKIYVLLEDTVRNGD
jgi:hypothetical protein